MRSRYLAWLWHSIADRGREILALRHPGRKPQTIEALCRDLLSEKGEASGTAIARDIVDAYEAMDDAGKLSFFTLLDAGFSPDVETVVRAAEAYRAMPNPDTLIAIVDAVEPPRRELIHRINLAPNGIASIVAMRARLLGFLPEHPELRAVDADLQHLLRSWFNRGFLVLKRIDWSTPAAVLEKLIRYDAVHEIRGWQDMHRRLEEDRRCFAFFHPALPDEPLIFVEVALLDGIPTSIGPLLDCEIPPQDVREASTAVFYSINACQDGLRGISFGHFLIKQVVADLQVEQPQLTTFVTLSPVSNFCAWLEAIVGRDDSGLSPKEVKWLQVLTTPDWHRQDEVPSVFRDLILKLCARFFFEAKENGKPLDPVEAFHLGNGARIERINWLADTSAKRMRQSAGVMVNYSYRSAEIEKNHEGYVNHGKIAASAAVQALRRHR